MMILVSLESPQSQLFNDAKSIMNSLYIAQFVMILVSLENPQSQLFNDIKTIINEAIINSPYIAPFMMILASFKRHQNHHEQGNVGSVHHHVLIRS